MAQAGLTTEFIRRLNFRALMAVKFNQIHATRELAEKHYPDSEKQLRGMGSKSLEAMGEKQAKKLFGTNDPLEIGKKLREWAIEFITSAPVTAMIVEGEDAVRKVREIIGHTDPSKAGKDTVRGEFSTDSIAKANSEKRAVHNVVHASGSTEEAEREIELWFGSDSSPS